jgi:type III secretion system YscQ/HrcQ family protein
MKAEYKIEGQTQELAQPTVPAPDDARADPFAEDLFKAHKTSVHEGAGGVTAQLYKEPVREPVLWHSRLPRVTLAEVAASAAIAVLPAEFYAQMLEAVINVLSRYTRNARNQVSIALTDFADKPLPFALASQGAPRVFAAFACEPNRTPFSIELDALFSIRLIDRMLGGSGEPPNSLRSLTTAELAVIEFLFLSIAAELNEQVDAPLLLLESIGEQSPWMTGTPGARTDTQDLSLTGLAAAWRIDVGEIAGLAHAHLSAQSLSQLSQAHKQLRDVTTNRSSAYAEAKARSYAAIVPDLSLAIQVGKTELSSAELSGLECGDVMVVERPDLIWRDGSVSGSLRVHLADGAESLILGDVSEATRSTIKLNVGSITIGDSGESGGRLFMPEETESEETTPDEANGIDGVMLTVHVQLAAKRLRLDELARLRTNQVLDLGCQATDPVDLVVDGRQVARGELVDIEGRLGVRIKQISTRAA